VSDSDSDGSPILPSATKSTPGARDKERDGKHPLRNSVSASHLLSMASGFKNVKERKVLRVSVKEKAKEKKSKVNEGGKGENKEKKEKKGFEYVPHSLLFIPLPPPLVLGTKEPKSETNIHIQKQAHSPLQPDKPVLRRHPHPQRDPLQHRRLCPRGGAHRFHKSGGEFEEV
jgi:hypothetical protein